MRRRTVWRKERGGDDDNGDWTKKVLPVLSQGGLPCNIYFSLVVSRCHEEIRPQFESIDPRDTPQIERQPRSLHLRVKIILSLSCINILYTYDETVDEHCKYTIQ